MQEFPVIIQEVITDANAALLKAPLAIPLHLQAPYDIAEVRYGLTQTPTVGQGPSGGFAGLQVRALALLTQPQSTDRPVQLVAECCLVADPWPVNVLGGRGVGDWREHDGMGAVCIDGCLAGATAGSD